MNQYNIILRLPGNQSQSWTHWNEIQHYGGWLRHIGDFHSNLTIGGIACEPWNKKEKQRAKEISNKYSGAHSVGGPGPNDTVNVAYRYKSSVKNFSMSRKEVSDIREEVLMLVSKQMETTFEVTCALCGSSSEGSLVACGHINYHGIDTRSPALFIRPPNTEVTAIIQFRSEISKGTAFAQGILMPKLAKGVEIERLISPVSEADCSKAQRDKDRIRIPLHKPHEGATGVIREIGFFSGDTLIFYESV